MKTLVVGIADCQASGDVDSSLVSYALGSCVGVAVYDPVRRIGGLLHYLLPESSLDPAKAQRNPYMFADTGIPLLLRMVCQASGDARRLVVQAAGGANIIEGEGVFDIGRRNGMALRRILSDAGLRLHGEALGGTSSRTVKLDLATGEFWIREGGKDPVTLFPVRCGR
jgi:chemotaxis protein CheD